MVEDSPEDREAYRRALQDRYELLETDSGEEALRLYAQAKPDCIVLDYSLGDTDAIDFLRAIKGEAPGLPTAVVVVTGQGNERVAVQAMKLGIEDYVVKGRLGELGRIVEGAIARHRAGRERFYRLLIVDDNAEDREFYKRRLSEGQSSRYEFREAETCADGLELCREWSPDCVILDYALPDADGLSFMVQLRGAPATDGIAVVIVTGQGNEAVAVQALKLGAQDYVVKSSAIDGLRQAIHGAVEKVRLQRKIDQQQRELARSEQMLREADRRKDEFLAMLAHELRNPLSPMKSSIDLLRLRGEDRPTVQFVRDVLDRQVRHMARLVDDLLDVTRITRGTVALRPERTDLARFVRDALEDHRPALEAAGLGLSVRVPELPVWVNGDPARIAQVLSNLLSNAAKFTARGGRIEAEVSMDASRSLASVAVADSGLGIDEQVLPRIFDIFAQADRSLERKDGGLGLGLAIARGLVQLHGGTIEARSAGIGKGTTIRFSLPLQAEPVAVAVREVRPRRGGRGARVLIVEDNRDAADTLRMILELQHYEVSVACSGPDGVRAAIDWGPDAVLCDIGLPGMDGYAVARALRHNPRTRSARLIAITGYGKDADRQRAKDSGFDDHIVKPADPEVLLDKLEASAR
jgi:CheY-like chemotaxis protein/two-component sensor histidine kinase